MILPGKDKLEGVIGTTFDFVAVLYPSKYANLIWSKNNSEWKPTTVYKINQVAVAENGSAYKSLKENSGLAPESHAEDWEKLTPLNLTSYKAWVHFGAVLELKSPSEGVTLGGEAGTVSVKASKVQTEKFTAGTTNMSLFLEDNSGNYYEYLMGPVKWVEQSWKHG